jgi:hypothetical protein
MFSFWLHLIIWIQSRLNRKVFMIALAAKNQTTGLPSQSSLFRSIAFERYSNSPANAPVGLPDSGRLEHI